MCFKKHKPSSISKIVASSVVLGRVQQHFHEDYEPGDPKLPCGLCSRCNLILSKIDQGKATPQDLDDPVDFASLVFPPITRSIYGDRSKILHEIYLL